MCFCVVRSLCLQETENHTQNGFRREETLWTLPGIDQMHRQSLVWPPFLGPSPLMRCPPTLVYIFSNQIECKHTHTHTILRLASIETPACVWTNHCSQGDQMLIAQAHVSCIWTEMVPHEPQSQRWAFTRKEC